jgi:hypothetical protein
MDATKFPWVMRMPFGGLVVLLVYVMHMKVSQVGQRWMGNVRSSPCLCREEGVGGVGGDGGGCGEDSRMEEAEERTFANVAKDWR